MVDEGLPEKRYATFGSRRLAVLLADNAEMAPRFSKSGGSTLTSSCGVRNEKLRNLFTFLTVVGFVWREFQKVPRLWR